MQTHPLPGSHLRLLNGPMTGAELASLLIAIGCWQVWFYVSLRGWPFSGINSCAQRLATANVSVLGAGLLTYFTIRQLGGPAEAISSCGGVFIAAVLLQGMLFEGWPHAPDDPSRDWRIALGFSVVLAAALFGLFTALAGTATWTTAKPSQWVAYAGLNAIGMGVVLHVALGRRWPFDPASRQ